jgi:hypothetical protein
MSIVGRVNESKDELKDGKRKGKRLCVSGKESKYIASLTIDASDEVSRIAVIVSNVESINLFREMKLTWWCYFVTVYSYYLLH